MDKELQKMFRKHGITARKFLGDNQGSWTVFIDGRLFITGLADYEVSYYKKQALEKAIRETDRKNKDERR